MLGFDPVKESIEFGTAKGVYLTQDVSAKTKKEIVFICEKNHTKMTEIPVTMDDIFAAVGKYCAVVAITEKGFADKLNTLAGQLLSDSPQTRRNDTI